MNITTKEFGIVDEEKVYLFTLENNRGMKLSCSNFGCVVTEILAPDRNGIFENVVLGFNNVDQYIQHKTYFGAVVGRVAGRIKDAEFELDGKQYILPKTEGNNHIHGGVKGLHERVWLAEPIEQKNAVGMKFTYFSKNGEEGYPGNVELTVTYLLTNDNQWIFTCHATTDQKTILNVTNHSYFNLTGQVKDDILNHELTLKCDRFLELDKELLPTGNIINVENTVFDFRQGRKIIDGVHSNHPQNILVGNGYDHPFIFTENHNREIFLKESVSGRTLTVETNQPCVVLYSSNQLQGDFTIQEGVQARKYLGLCLETQGLPDAIHHPHFPSIVLDKGETYELKTVYSFGVEQA